MKRITLWLCMVLCMFAFFGCSKEDETSKEDEMTGKVETSEGIETPEEIILTGEYAPIAEYTRVSDVALDWDRGYIYKNSEVIGLSKSGNELLAYAVNGSDMPRVVAETGSEGSWIRGFFIDMEDNLYLCEVSMVSQDEAVWCLKKVNADGQEVFKTDITEDRGRKSLIYVDYEGNVALIDSLEWEICFFDSEGQYRGKDTVASDTAVYGEYGLRTHMPRVHNILNNMVCIDGRYFLWRVNEGTEGSISFWEVDFEECHISEEKVIEDMEFLGPKTQVDTYSCVLFDGGELGLLLSTEEVLWQYDTETGALTELLRWDDNHISVDGRFVKQINVGEAGEGGTALEVFVYDVIAVYYSGDDMPEALSITYVDKAYIKENRVVSIGLSNTSDGIEQTIRRFNRDNNGYEVVMVDYDPTMLKDMLSYGKEIPDLLDVTDIRTEWLENKNLLEDLTPYFERSGKVSKEDILPAVWELLERDNGKLTSIATGFKIRALTTAADLPEDGWTYSQLLSLEEQYPGSLYMRQHTPTWVWSLISMTGVDEFIDWEKRKCSFDSQEFRDLIEGVKNLDYPENQKLDDVTDTLGLVMARQILMQYSNYGSPYDYEQEQEESGGGLKAISFPTMGGEPTYIFAASQSLAIYGESPNKDGAWAFLEFLLDEEQQRWYGANKDIFPVNADAFENYLARPNNNRSYSNAAAASEETQEKIRYMASHLALNQNAADEISSIINEELKAYFAGDKTVKQTAKTIQNRVQLYLDEM